MVKGNLTAYGAIGISIATTRGCTESRAVIQRIAQQRALVGLIKNNLINLQG